MELRIDSRLAKRLDKKQIEILKKFVIEKKEVPIRVVYTSDYWDKIAKDQKYELEERELTALKNSLKKLTEFIGDKKINLIHLGPGNGMETPFILNAIKPSRIDTYTLVDVNPTMLQLSEDRIKKESQNTKVKIFSRDFETYGIKDICQGIKKSGAEINVIILIANGVLFSNDDLVREINNSMDKEDYFYLTLELYEKGKDQEIIKPYLIPSVLDLLSNGLKIIGYAPKYSEFYGEIDNKSNLLNIYFAPGGDKTKKLLVLHSYKPTIVKLKERMKRLNFKEIFCEEYKNVHSCGSLYKK